MIVPGVNAGVCTALALGKFDSCTGKDSCEQGWAVHSVENRVKQSEASVEPCIIKPFRVDI
jgi:hypothetical protein